jgi:hypothetical protein
LETVAKAPDLTHTQANIQAASTRAGAYLSSWGSWASEKKKGWGTKSASTTPVSSPAANDMKRAEQFQREKTELGGGDRASQRWSESKMAPPEMYARDLDAEGGPTTTEAKRESLFFDAEKEKGRAKESEHTL